MPFEIVLLLFFLFSLYRKHQNDKKKREKLLQQEPSFDTHGSQEKGELNWEEAMKELESIFSGEPFEQKRPEPKPIEVTSAPVSTPQYSSASEAAEMERQRRLASIAERNKQRSDELSTLQLSASSSAGRQQEETNYVHLLESPQEIRNAIILKEILDKPKALRRDKAIF